MSVQAPALVSVVDDDPSVRRSLARLVKGAGYRVEAFASAHEFLARAPDESPACLLLDVRMPGLTGLDLQETLSIAAHWTSIIFITGYGSERIDQRFAHVPILQKSIQVDALASLFGNAAASAPVLLRPVDGVGS